MATNGKDDPAIATDNSDLAVAVKACHDVVAYLRNAVTAASPPASDATHATLPFSPSYDDHVDAAMSLVQRLLVDCLNYADGQGDEQSTPTPQARLVQVLRAFKSSLASHTLTTTMDLQRFFNLLVDFLWQYDLQLNVELEDVGRRNSDDSHDGEPTTTAITIEDRINERRVNLVELCTTLLEEQVISERNLKETMEPSLLEELDLVDGSAELWIKRLVRVNTGMFYRQLKYNLVQESSEGYVKLVCELRTRAEECPKDAVDEAYVNTTERMVTALIGVFDLDPNRVLAVVLDVMADTLAVEGARCVLFWVEFMKHSRWWMSRGANGTDKTQSSLQSFGGLVASLLGMKFRAVIGLSLLDPAENAGLYMSAAILISQGFMSLDDLYPHVALTEEQESTFHKRWLSKQVPTTESSTNALMASATLLDDGRSSAKLSKQDSPTAMDVDTAAKDDKPAAASTVQPWTVVKRDSDTWVEHPLAALCAALLVIGDFTDAFKLLKSNICIVHYEAKIPKWLCRALHWAIEPVYSDVCGLDGDAEFSYPPSVNEPLIGEGWPRGLDQATTVDQFIEHVLPLCSVMGGEMHVDSYLVTKMCRITAKQPFPLSPTWMTVLLRILLPALSLSHGNLQLNAEVWNIVKNMPYEARYALYPKWLGVYAQHPETRIARSAAKMETKRLMRRLSKENVREFGRILGKISHANPLVCWSVVVEQLQYYENMIEVAVDCFRYASPMGLDVLVYVLIKELVKPDRQRLKEDGANLATWLSNMSVLVGDLVGRGAPVEWRGLLKYLLGQGKSGNPYDLALLKQMVAKVSGLSCMSEGATDKQLEAMGGGRVLRREAIQAAPVASPKQASLRANNDRAATLLANVVIRSGHARDFALAMMRLRSSFIYKSDMGHLKLLGSVYDTLQESVLQYVEFMDVYLSDQEYTQHIADEFEELVNTYGVATEDAWTIVRKSLGPRVLAQSSADAPSILTPYHAQVLNVLPSDVWKGLSAEFYVTFWQLSLYELHTPVERYREEITKLEGRASAPGSREVKRLRQTIDLLKAEQVAQETAQSATLSRLQNESRRWFAESDDPVNAAALVIRHCVRPRCVYSATDASYCAKMLSLMHDLGTARYSSLSVMDNLLMTDVARAVTYSTQNEAMFYGRFLAEVLVNLHHWHGSQTSYDKNAVGGERPGLRAKWTVPTVDEEESAQSACLSFDEFRTAMHKWHRRMFDVFLAAFKSGDYIRTRNAIIILDSISSCFPRMRYMGQQLTAEVLKLTENEQRQDLKTLLVRYNSQLRKNQPTWTRVSEFFHAGEAELALDVKRLGEEEGELTPSTPMTAIFPFSQRETTSAPPANSASQNPEPKKPQERRPPSSPVSKSEWTKVEPHRNGRRPPQPPPPSSSRPPERPPPDRRGQPKSAPPAARDSPPAAPANGRSGPPPPRDLPPREKYAPPQRRPLPEDERKRQDQRANHERDRRNSRDQEDDRPGAKRRRVDSPPLSARDNDRRPPPFGGTRRDEPPSKAPPPARSGWGSGGGGPSAQRQDPPPRPRDNQMPPPNDHRNDRPTQPPPVNREADRGVRRGRGGNGGGSSYNSGRRRR